MPEHINIDVDFDASIDTTQVIGESIIVPTTPNFKGSRYVVRLKYTPYLGSEPQKPTIGGLTKVEGISPSSGEFRIVEESLNLTHPSPNILEFNAAQAGNSYSVNYYRYAETLDAEKTVFHDVLREVTKSDGLDLSNTATQILINARSYFYLRDKVIIEDNQVAVTTSLSASTTYYCYCDDFKGTNFFEGVYSISTTVPSFSTSLLGWYNNDSKAICKFTTDGSSNIDFVESLGYKEPQLKILTLRNNYTLNQYEDYDIIQCDGSNGDLTIALPVGAVVNGKKLSFKKIDSLGRATIIGTIGSFTNLYLDEDRSTLDLYYDNSNSEWKIFKYKNKTDYGYINSNDYTSRNLGTMQVLYDNLTGTYVLGEVVREYSDIARTIPTGVYGVIMTDTGSIFTLRNVSGGGTFTNNFYLKGDISGTTSDVNEVTGSTKNLDSNIYHGLGVDMGSLKRELYISTDGTDNNQRTVDSIFTPALYAGSMGLGYNAIDNNQFKSVTGTGGLCIFDDVSGDGNNIVQLDTEDYYYKNILTIEI